MQNVSFLRSNGNRSNHTEKNRKLIISEGSGNRSINLRHLRNSYDNYNGITYRYAGSDFLH